MRAILKLGKKSNQRYFLAPNISSLKDNMFTKDMEFFSLDFNTVYLEQHKLYESIQGNEEKKNKALLDVITSSAGRTLIYAGTFTNISSISTFVISEYKYHQSAKIKIFVEWLAKNYSLNWNLTRLVSKSTGIHSGRLHRSLSQIQVKLFEDSDGLKKYYFYFINY